MDDKNKTNIGDRVVRDALGISSGTIAGLIGNCRYDAIDKVQGEFVKFCDGHRGEFENWIQAWRAFYKPDTQPAENAPIFPVNINDPFYKKFDDPRRAYNNLPALYAYFLEHPSDEEISVIDHVNYARALAASNRS